MQGGFQVGCGQMEERLAMEPDGVQKSLVYPSDSVSLSPEGPFQQRCKLWKLCRVSQPMLSLAGCASKRVGTCLCNDGSPVKFSPMPSSILLGSTVLPHSLQDTLCTLPLGRAQIFFLTLMRPVFLCPSFRSQIELLF